MQNAAFETAVVVGPKRDWVRLIIYGLLLISAVMLAVLAADYFKPFLPAGLGPSAAARNSSTFWTNVESSNAENLVVSTADSPTKLPGQWTVAAQVIISDSRTPSLGKFRHILHRGSNPAGLAATASGSTGQAGIQPSDLTSADPTYQDTGLPDIMNPGVFLDKYKNDIHIFIHTKGHEGGQEVLWLESMTLADLPLNQAMNIGITCNGKSMDVYLNCRLYSSLLLRGTPYLPTSANQWFGRYGAFPFTGLIKNLTLWPTSLGSSDYIQTCRGAGSFNTASLPPSCPTAL